MNLILLMPCLHMATFISSIVVFVLTPENRGWLVSDGAGYAWLGPWVDGQPNFAHRHGHKPTYI